MKRHLFLLFSICALSVGAQQKDKFNIPADKIPNTPTIRVRRTVIDTLRARQQFDAISSRVYAEVLRSERRQKRCAHLQSSGMKKVTTSYDLSLLSDAYNHTLMHHPEFRNENTEGSYNTAIGYMMKDGVYDMTTIVYDADVQKGVLSKNVRTYLGIYSAFLTDSIANARAHIERNWLMYLDSIPTRKVVTEEPNPYYKQAPK